MHKDLLELLLTGEEVVKKRIGEQFSYADEDVLQVISSPLGEIVNSGGKIAAVSKPDLSPVDAIRFYEHVLDSLPQGFSGDLDRGVDIRYLLTDAGNVVYITGHMD